MCLIAFAFAVHPLHRLVLAANRDELHARPTKPAGYWDDYPDIFGGRDLTASGTWLGVTKRGRFAALTNVRARGARRDGKSRGLLVRDILVGGESIDELTAQAAVNAPDYPAFNLIVGDEERIFYLRDGAALPEEVGPGVHGLSNARLDVPWPKVERAKAVLDRELTAVRPLDRDAIFEMLGDRATAADPLLPETGVTPDVERMLSAPFIVSPVYGTRCSTLLIIDRDHTISFEERSFDPAGTLTNVVRETIPEA